MGNKPLPKEQNIYETDCPILYAMEIIGQKWKLPILWYMADAENQTLRYGELERKVVGITPTMLTKMSAGIGTRQAGETKTVQYDSADRRVFSERIGKDIDSGPAVGL